MAPRVEIITQMVCEVHRPEYTIGRGNSSEPDSELLEAFSSGGVTSQSMYFYTC